MAVSTAKKFGMMLFRPIFFCLVALCLFVIPGSNALAMKKTPYPVALYTAMTATTPQVPLWAAINAGWPQGGEVAVAYWKTLDDLRGTMLAGKGDIWVGHLEGFAQAALRGAPIRLVAVTGWKKFYFVATKALTATNMASLATELRERGQALAVPQASPAIAILEHIRNQGGPSFSLAVLPPQQLRLEILRGTYTCALVPEPLVSALLEKKETLRAVAGLEDEFARLYGGPPRLPFVGIAVHERFAQRYPQHLRELTAAMQMHAERLALDAKAAFAVLPKSIRENVGEAVFSASFPRDSIISIPAAAMVDEIASFLRMTLPTTPPAAIDALVRGSFIWRER